jgi:hypothetical protein
MATCQGSLGRLRICEDFLGPDNDLTWGTGTVQVGQLGFVSVNEGSFEWMSDEANGVIAVTTDTGDNDNACFMVGPFIPAVNGALILEARFKFNSASLGAVFCGFSETLDLATPVMPAEFAGTTMTYNGTGQMIGAQWDSDATTGDFRAVFGDAGAVLTGADANGTRANQTITADEWYLVRVELSSTGVGEVWVGHNKSGMESVKRVTGNPTTNPLFAILMFENRSAAARVFKSDYVLAEATRDWEVT